MLSVDTPPPALLKISGALGKKIVVKQYRGKQVVTRYPDMSGIVPSQQQKVSRRLFTRAVRYAQSIYRKPELKAEWNRKLRRPRRLFQALMKQYYKQVIEKQERADRRIMQWQRSVKAKSDWLQAMINLVPQLLLQNPEQKVKHHIKWRTASAAMQLLE